MHQPKLKYLILSIALLLGGNAMAQIEDTSTLRMVVATGEIMPTQSSQSVQNVKIITAKIIERQGAVNLKDLLSKELNIRISNDNILGSSLSLQGISGQNIKILLDGVPLIGRENGNIDLNQINLSNIERVEIIEGPLSVIYGTDALGGVINLISKKVLLGDKESSRLNGNIYYETIGQYNVGGGAVAKIKTLDTIGHYANGTNTVAKGSNMDFAATMSRNFFGGYNSDKTSRTMLWKPKQQVFGSFSILNEKGKLRLRFKTDIFNEKIENRGTPVINHLEGYAFDEYYTTNRVINSLNLDYKKDDSTYENFLASLNFYQRDKTTYLKDLVTTESKLVPSREANSSNSFLNVMTRGSYNKLYNSKLNYQYGFDFNFNSAFGTRIESDKGRMNDVAIFACAELKYIKNLNIKPGFRATYNSRYPAPFIPSIQLQYIALKNKLTIRYSYGKGFRAPSLKELYLNFVDYNHNIQGNSDLKSEISNNYNFALKYRLKVKKKYMVFLENNNYFNHIYNQISLISLNPNINEYTYMNIDNFRSIGMNFNVSTQFAAWNISSGFSYLGIYNNAFASTNNYKFSYSPEVRNQIGYTLQRKHSKAKTTFSIFHKYNGKRIGYVLDDTRTKVIQTKVAEYTIFDCTVNHPFFNKKMVLTTGCKNILNVTNISTTGSPGFHSGGANSMPVSIGRSFFIQLNFTI